MGQLIEAGSRETQISSQLTCLDEVANELSNAALDLLDRLQPVLRETSKPTEEERSPEQVLVPLADKIRKINKRLTTVSETLFKALANLEL